MEVGKIRLRVAEILAERGMSRQELVDATGIRYQTVLTLVRNSSTRIDFATIAKLCHGLNAEVGDLLVYEPPV